MNSYILPAVHLHIGSNSVESILNGVPHSNVNFYCLPLYFYHHVWMLFIRCGQTETETETVSLSVSSLVIWLQLVFIESHSSSQSHWMNKFSFILSFFLSPLPRLRKRYCSAIHYQQPLNASCFQFTSHSFIHSFILW